MKPVDVIIVGGGWAGISAAARAVDHGLSAVLLEAAPQLGGRCFSFYDRRFGEWLDNGVHVFIGAYREALSLLRRWKMDKAVDFKAAESIHWQDAAGWEAVLETGINPLSSGLGLMQFRALSLGERLAAARCTWRMGKEKLDTLPSLTVAEYLRRQGIDAHGAGGLWEAICLAALNASPERADIRPLIAAVQEGLLLGGQSGRLGILTQPFRQLLSEPALNYLTQTGVMVRLRTRAHELLSGNDGEVTGVRAGAERLLAGRIILALPPREVYRLVKPLWGDALWVEILDRWEYSTITSAHLTFDRPVFPRLPMFLQDSCCHWLFGRGEREKEGWRRVSTVVSSAKEESAQFIAFRTIHELRERFLQAGGAAVAEIKVVRNRRATVLLAPGTRSLRPSPTTSVMGLSLAGDWCDSELPATIESAARSGRRAIEEIITG